MRRQTSIGELEALRDLIVGDRPEIGPTIVINAGTCGQASGANDLIRAAKREILRQQPGGDVGLRITGCHGFCQMEPSILVEPSRTFYPRVKAQQVPSIMKAAAAGQVVEELLFKDPTTGERIQKQDDIPFFKDQERLLLGPNERLDPIRIYNYLAIGGYTSFCRALERNDPAGVIEQVKSSGLRGRGGAGFPAGLKWEMLAGQSGSRGKYLVCNADEGDPGAYMDRSLLEGNPHSIIEGMLIGAFATGATAGIVYVRAEYPLAIKHLTIALRQARDLGLLGNDILGTGFCFDISITKGAGAFVCGEETALMRSVEGKMGEPRQRPPFPVQSGINGRPTAINNVETWANIPLLLKMGAEAFSKVGVQGSSGTKVFSLVGKISNTGLVEVPMGMTIRHIVEEIGGGAVGDVPIKAVQTGGPSGGCIPAKLFDLPIGYDSLAEVGSIMGSGGMIVMDENTCMVDVAKYFMYFLSDESCGKCFTCRKGTQRMHEVLDDISNGIGGPEQLELLEELAMVTREASMCALGQTAANPVLSTLKYFRDEYLEHLNSGRCPAGVCKGLITFSINDLCNGCTLCVGVCPEKAILGAKKEQHRIDDDACIRCGACKSVCKHGAVQVR